MREYRINRKLARQLMDSEYADLFEAIAKKTEVSPTVIAVALTETMKALKREGINIQKVTDTHITEIFQLIGSGKTTKEAIPDTITWLSQHEGRTAKDAVEDLGLTVLTPKELEAIVNELVRKNERLIQDKGANAFGPLMAIIMKRVRGRAEAETVSEVLKRILESLT